MEMSPCRWSADSEFEPEAPAAGNLTENSVRSGKELDGGPGSTRDSDTQILSSCE